MKPVRSESSRANHADCAPTLTHTESAPTGDVGTPRSASHVELDDDDAHFHVDGEYARGGIGRILLARDRRLERPVAIKELLVSRADAERRFIREAQLTARLQHPSIVPVYEVGRWAHGRPFYAMKFITGRTLKQILDETTEFDGRLALLPHVIAVAEAIAYAHSNRIVHRDIKPSNVVIGSFGETMVVDWGLAKDLSEPHDAETELAPYRGAVADLTVTGSVIGTPAYMPPEQAAGDVVDERADVYALGALLFHVLSGAPPYRGERAIDVVQSVLAGPPVALSRRQRGVPTDLLAIVEKAMKRDPNDRYRDAAQLAEDLKRFQRGQLVGARVYSGVELGVRWAARHRVMLAFVGLTAVGGGLAVSRVVREKNRAEARTNEMVIAHARAWLDRDPTTAVAWLKHYPPGGSDWASVRDVGLDGAAAGVARHVFRRANSNSYGAFSPDGRRFVVAAAGAAIDIRDVGSGALRQSLAHDGLPYLTLFVTNDRVVFVDTRRLAVHVWDLSSNRERVLFDGEGAVSFLDATKDGRFAATANADGTVRLFDLDAGTGRILGAHHAAATYIRFSPDGRLLASIAEDHSLWLWNLTDGTRRDIGEHGDLNRLDFSPDGRALAAGDSDGTVHVWSLDDGKHQRLRGHQGVVRDVRFSHDGTLLASVGDDKTVRLWDWRHGGVRVWNGHGDAVYRVAFSPDDDLVASASRDETVRLWSRRTGELRVLRGHTSMVFDVEFAPNGHWLASNSLDHSVRIWSTPDDLVRAYPLGAQAVADVAFADDSHVLTGGTDGLAKLSSTVDGAAVTVAAHDGGVRRVVVSADRSRLVSMTHRGTVSLLDRTTGAQYSYDMRPVPAWAAAVSCGGDTVAIAGGDGTVRVWSAQSGAVTVLRAHRADAYSVAYSPDCRWLASGGADGDVHLWDARRLSHERVLRGDGARVALVAFSSDSQFLGSVDWSGRLRLWDVAHERSRLIGDGSHERLVTIAFQPGGRLVAAAGDDGAIRLWDTSGRLVRTLRGHQGAVQQVLFSPDGATLASCSDDHTVRLWKASTGAELRVLPHRAQIRRIAFSPDGRLIAAAARDPEIYIWRTGSAISDDERPAAAREWINRLTTVEADTFAIPSSR